MTKGRGVVAELAMAEQRAGQDEAASANANAMASATLVRCAGQWRW
jgi:hypothetical protein